MVRHPLRYCFVIGYQAVAPLLCLMQRQGVACAAHFLFVQRILNSYDGFFAEFAHQLAHVLHLTALAFKVGDAPCIRQSIT